MAEMQTARHASDMSPGSVAQAALGTPMREAPVAGVPTPASSPKPKQARSVVAFRAWSVGQQPAKLQVD